MPVILKSEHMLLRIFILVLTSFYIVSCGSGGLGKIGGKAQFGQYHVNWLEARHESNDGLAPLAFFFTGPSTQPTSTISEEKWQS